MNFIFLEAVFWYNCWIIFMIDTVLDKLLYFLWIMNSVNYSLCSVAKRMSIPQEKSIILYYSWFHYLIFFSWFSVSRPPSMNRWLWKHRLRIIKIGKLLSAVFFFLFCHLQAVLSDTFSISWLNSFHKN